VATVVFAAWFSHRNERGLDVSYWRGQQPAGVAGGELVIPTFVFGFGADINAAGTASLLVSLPMVAVGVLRYRASGGYAAKGAVRHVGVPMAVGSLAGAILGAALVGWVDIRLLKSVLGVVLAVSALRMWRAQMGRDGAVDR
jgi:uncharacterized protein